MDQVNEIEREHILQFFKWDHLPPNLAEVSRPFGELAEQLVSTLPRNPERTVALRKLLESKDAAVRVLVTARNERIARESAALGAVSGSSDPTRRCVRSGPCELEAGHTGACRP